nr:Set1/Ash2 histone methyltransferase complex subunit ASH2 [Polyrhizophydium stewartii]
MRGINGRRVDVVHIVLFNLAHTMQARKVSADNRKFFHWKLDICTFIDNNWNLFWLKPRINTWRNSVASCLSTSLRFISGTRHFENEQEAAGLWALDTLRFPSAIDYGRKSRMYAYSIAPNGTLIEDEAAKKDKDKKRKKTDDERAGSPDPADPATPPSTGGGGSVGGPSALTPAAFAAAAAAKAAKAKASATLPLIKTQSLGGSDSGTDAAKRRRPSKPKKKPEEPAKTGQDKPPQPTNTPVEEEIDSATAIMIYPDIENPKTAVVMSSQPTHTAPQVKVSDNGRLVQTDKGYRMSKASHGVWEGHWYFEIKKETAAGHCRVGWSQISGDLQGPCGYDQFSYAFRDQPGALFHKSMQLKDAPEAYHEGFDQGDVIGLSIYFPPQPPPAGPTASSKVAAFMNKAARIAAETVARVVAAGSKDDKDGKDGRDPIDLKNIDIKNIDLKAIDLKNIDLKSIESPTRAAMVEAAASLPLQAITSGRLAVAVDPVLLSRLWDPERMLQYMPFRSKPLATTHGSEIRFFKNGRPLGAAFRDLYQGKYHPAVSLFGGAAVSINFGPKFAFSPPEGAKPFSEVVSLGSWAEAREMMNKQQADIEAADALRRRVKAAERRRQRHAKAAAAKAAAEAAAAGGGAPGSAGPPSKPAPGSGSGQSAAASGALSAAATPVVVKTEPGGGAADVAMTDSRPASKETTPTSGPMDLGSLLASDPGVVSDSSAGGALWRSSSGVGGGASAASGSQGMPMHVQVKDEHDAEGVAVRAGGGAPASAGSSGLMDDDGESVSEHGEGDTAPPL